MWLWITVLSPLAMFTRHINFTEAGGDHDNKLQVVLHFFKSFAGQVLPVAVLCFAIPCWIMTTVYSVNFPLSATLCILIGKLAHWRGWRLHTFTVVVSAAPYMNGKPLVFPDWKKKHPGGTMQDFLYAKESHQTKNVLYSRSRENQFAHELVAFFRSFGVPRHMYTLVRGENTNLFQFLSPEAVFRPSVMFEAIMRGEEDVEGFYKRILRYEWAEHEKRFVSNWFDANAYDAHFRDYVTSIRPRDWIVAVNGGPFTNVAAMCERNPNVVVISMAFSKDTSKNIFKQNANCLFDMPAAANVVGATDAPSAYLSFNVDTKFVKEKGPRFLGRTPAESAAVFNREMGGKVDDETLTMYQHCTFVGAPTPWETVDDGEYGTFFIFDTLAVSLFFQGRWDLFEPASLHKRTHTGQYIHDKGMYDLAEAVPAKQHTFFVTRDDIDALTQHRLCRVAKEDLRQMFAHN